MTKEAREELAERMCGRLLLARQHLEAAQTAARHDDCDAMSLTAPISAALDLLTEIDESDVMRA